MLFHFMMAVLLLSLLNFVAGAVNHESAVTADGAIREHVRHHHIHRSHEPRRPDPLAYGAPPVSSILAELAGQQEAKASTTTLAPKKLPPVRQDGKFPVINEWACALMCASHGEDGCCTYKDNSQHVGDENDGDNFEEDTGLCEFRPGFAGIEEALASPSAANGSQPGAWTSAQCIASYGTSKCAAWRRGKCVAKGQELQTASKGLPIWDLVWEDHFDRLTCVPDGQGVLRPNPQFWTSEIGYKRGKESQWYQPQNVECREGALVITARREKLAPGNKCEVKGHPDGQKLDADACDVCGPPGFHYGEPCDLVLEDGSPACDCAGSAEYTSGSIMTQGKQEFSYGMLEMRAKIDTRPGAWSSWWAIGDFENVPWPKNGEIDIMDAFQGMLKASVIHAGENGLPSGAVFHAAARLLDAEWQKHFHTWTLEWDKDFVIIRVDRQELLKLDLSVADPVRTTWPNPFTSDKKFFMILNLAVGGHTGGDASLSEFPTTLEVDYIKYYQKKGRTDR
ncbi:unnamed protein product [Effrenium voratum]|nr:unnamed protein product [Effrenium voratum]